MGGVAERLKEWRSGGKRKGGETKIGMTHVVGEQAAESSDLSVCGRALLLCLRTRRKTADSQTRNYCALL